MKKILLLAMTCIIIVAIAALAGVYLFPPWARKEQYIEIIDQAGRKIRVPADVRRVVSLWPEATRVTIALGAGDKLLGVSIWDTKDPIMLRIYPKLKELPAVGTVTQPNVEEIVRLKPDVILFDALRAAMADDLQQKTGIPVVCVRLNPPALKGEFSFEIFEILGKVLGKEERGKFLREYLESKLDMIRNVTSKIPEEERLKVYVTFARDPLTTYGLADPLRSAGLVNVAYNPRMVWYKVSMEQVIAWNPDIVIVHFLRKRMGNYTVEDILGDPRWQQVKAVKEGRVYVVIVGYVGWYPAMLVINTMQLAKIAYPEKFTWLDVVREANEIYETLYGVSEFFERFAEEWGLYVPR